MSLTERALDGESVPGCVVHDVRQKGMFVLYILVARLFKWTVTPPPVLYVQGLYTPSELLTGESCSILGEQFSFPGPGLEMPFLYFSLS